MTTFFATELAAMVATGIIAILISSFFCGLVPKSPEPATRNSGGP